MTTENKISRRHLFGIVAAGLATASVTSIADAQEQPSRRANGEGQGQRRQGGQARRPRTLPQYTNEDFYKDGKFDVEKTRDIIIEFCNYHRYPVYPGLREKLWISDYGLGKFTEVGLSCVGFVNNLDGEYSYMMQDLFLLPNQMLPEHWHEKPEDTKTGGAQKDEGWLIRWGRSYVIGEGDANLPPEVAVPKSHGPVTVEHCTVADPGVFVKLTRRGSRHWQLAGKEGVILTEVANYHNNPSVRHTNKTANDTFLNG